jgi:hypothetical protein
VNFENEVLRNSGSTSQGGYFDPLPFFQKYGKGIFLIQDAKTKEVLWMGNGILTTNKILDSKEIKDALDQLIGGLK